MKYTILAKSLAWVFPTKADRKAFRHFCENIDSRKDIELIHARYSEVINKLQHKSKNQKLKIVFLSSENAKWSYQSVYEEFAKNPNCDVQVLITVRDGFSKKRYRHLNYVEQAKNNYELFKSRGMNVDFAFDFKKMKHKDLKEFKPDIIFYEQPWEIVKEHSVENTSKYALTIYSSYGSCITNGQNEYTGKFYQEIFTYFLDNKYIKGILQEHGMKENCLVVSGQLKLDAYLKPLDETNIKWKSTDKKRILFAPHHSFYQGSTLGFGTFDWNYKFFYEFAKNHPEYEFILKPHPEIKRQIVKYGLMTTEEMINYFNDWENLPNAQVVEGGNYFDMFRTSDLLITDCNSFLYEYLPTKKPVLHLIDKHSVGHNEFGQKIIAGYYPAKNIEEIQDQLELLLIKGDDPLKIKREQIIKEDLLQPEGGTARFIVDYLLDTINKE